VEPNSEHIAEQHRLETKAEPKTKPLGEVMLPALICGAVGAVLTIILALIGRYGDLDLGLKEYYMGEPFYMSESSSGGWHPAWDWILVLALTFGVSFAVLDTDKQWRRVMIILLFSVVVILSSPVLMLWDVFWSPMTVFVGVLWSWMCAFIYSCQHTMPCELLLPPKLIAENKQGIDISPLEEAEQTPEEKYQPKDQSSCPD
jgi:hypothetical protein